MRRIIFFFAIIGSLAVSSRMASADAIPELTRFLESEITAAENAIGEPASQAQASASFDEDWYYRRFWLRVRAPAGIDVPWVFKLQVIPEVELLWERDLPEGWGGYKP